MESITPLSSAKKPYEESLMFGDRHKPLPQLKSGNISTFTALSPPCKAAPPSEYRDVALVKKNDSRPNLSSNIFKEDPSFSGFRTSLVPYEQHQLQQHVSTKQDRECRFWVAVIVTSASVSAEHIQSLLREVGEVQQMVAGAGNWYFMRFAQESQAELAASKSYMVQNQRIAVCRVDVELFKGVSNGTPVELLDRQSSKKNLTDQISIYPTLHHEIQISTEKSLYSKLTSYFWSY